MTDPTFVHGPREDAKPLRWLALATSTDKTRPGITGIHIDGGLTMATDGFRLHVAPTPATVAPLEGQIIRAKWPAMPQGADYAAHVEIVDDTYPNTRLIVDQARQRPVGATVRLNAKYLKDFLDGLGNDDHVELTIPARNSGPVILATTANAKTPERWALIMPVSERKVAAAYDPWAKND